MLDEHQLRKTLSHLDGRGYKAYKQIQGRFEFPDFELLIDHVQGDPFAQPSKIRLRVQQEISQIPERIMDKLRPTNCTGRFYGSCCSRCYQRNSDT